MSFGLWRIRTGYKLRMLWRLKLPQAICGLLGRHAWLPILNWSGISHMCSRCLKRRNDKGS